MNRSPEGLIALLAFAAILGVVIALFDVAKKGRRPLLGGTWAIVFGAACAFMSWTLRDSLDATRLALWLVGTALFVMALMVLSKKRAG